MTGKIGLNGRAACPVEKADCDRVIHQRNPKSTLEVKKQRQKTSEEKLAQTLFFGTSLGRLVKL